MSAVMKIEVVDGRIWMQMPWLGKEASEASKRIVQNNRWNPSVKVRTYPLEREAYYGLLKFAKKYNLQVIRGGNLRDWVAEMKPIWDSIPDVNSKELIHLPNLEKNFPIIWKAVEERPFQTVGIQFITANKFGLIADDPGLGKTLQTLGSVANAGITGVIGVVAPKTALKVTWPQQIEQWLPGDEIFHLGDRPGPKREAFLHEVFEKAAANPDKRFWLLMTSHYVRMSAQLDDYGNYVYDDSGNKIITGSTMEEMFNKEFGAFIVDESHLFLACATNNKKKFSMQRLGFDGIKLKPNGLRIALSGTPMRGKPENMFGQAQWLRPDLHTSFWKWVDRYFEVYEDMNGAKEQGALKDKAKFYQEASKYMIRREKAEVAPDLPPKIYGGTLLDPGDPTSVHGVWLDMEPKQRKLYDQMVREAIAEMEKGTIVANGILAEMTRLKQFAQSYGDIEKVKKNRIVYRDIAPRNEEGEPDHGLEGPHERKRETKAIYEEEFRPKLPSNKFDWIVQFLDERGISAKSPVGTGKVVIASQFTTIVNMYARELNNLGIATFVLTGETSDKKRREYQEEFQSKTSQRDIDAGTPRVFLLNTKAGGTSITLDAADDVIINDETFIPDDQLQVEDRAHRLSRLDHQVTIWYLRSRETLEQKIGKTTSEREAICRDLMDGQRGIDISKKLMGVAA